RHIAVLGDMLELGSHAEPEHAALGALAAELGIDLVVAVGEAGAATADAARAGGVDALVASDRDDAAAMLEGRIRPGDAVLVKASRAVGLETLANALAGDEGAA